MARIKERKDRHGKTKYTVEVRLKGYPPKAATFDRKTDAKAWAQVEEVAMRKGRHSKTSEGDKMTFADMVDRYKRDILPSRMSDRRDVERHLDWWNDQLGPRFLKTIDSNDITKLRDKLLAEKPKSKEKRTPSTVVRYLASLSICYSYAAREWKWVEQNPVKDVRKPKEPRGRVRFLSDTERAALLTACQQVEGCPALYPVVLLALSTGARLGEIMGLEWRDIDFRRRLVIFRDTKNGESRSVPISRRAFEILDGMRKVRRIDCVLVFPNEEGTGPARIRNPWNKVVDAAGLHDFKFHDLRHTAASYLAMEGATLLEIAEILGHKTLAMVKRYAHLTEGHTRNVLERMAERQLGSAEPKTAKPARKRKG